MTNNNSESDLLSLKFIAIFTILISGGVGALLPSFINTSSNISSLLLLIAKIFSAGIVLGTGFVHLIPDSEENFLNVFKNNDYPYTSFIAGLSCITIMLVEQLIHRSFENQNNPQENNNNESYKYIISHSRDHSHNHLHTPIPQQYTNSNIPNQENQNNQLKTNELEYGTDRFVKYDFKPIKKQVSKEKTYTSIRDYFYQNDDENLSEYIHNSDDMHNSNNSTDSTNSFNIHTNHCHQINILHEDTVNLKKLVTVYILELGIAVHSIMIGMTIGTNNNYTSLVTLILAIIFHQFFEGIALGSTIITAEFLTIKKTIAIIIFYSMTTPFGIILGIIIKSSCHTESPNSYIIQGILNAVSAGILIYMALIHLIIQDFNNNKIKFTIKILMSVSLIVGFLLTSLISLLV